MALARAPLQISRWYATSFWLRDRRVSRSPCIEIMPDCGGIYTLPALVGAARAHALAMLSPIVNAEQAEQIGLICRMVEDHDQESERRKVVERLIQAAPSALAATKRALRESAGLA
jgi:2-(1,2-epoxy-1,2-dihydrophenyl)acetyl-CoA isomerase